MARDLDEQLSTVERALAERMIEHALIVVRTWLNELGENNSYEEAFVSIQKQYNDLFTEWLSVDDNTVDEHLNILTGETYRLVDAVYADIRLQRGLTPSMHGYNKENMDSVANYFFHCIRLQQQDLNWLQEAYNKEEPKQEEMVIPLALSYNLKSCFSEHVFLTLIEGLEAKNHLMAEHCMIAVLKLLIQYDRRLDFFPEVQKAFVEAIQRKGDDGDDVFQSLWAWVRATKLAPPFGQTEEQYNDEMSYYDSLISILPDTWLYQLLVLDDARREYMLATAYLDIGHNELMWDRLDAIELWLKDQLRQGKDSAYFYINYGHCVLLRGDRMMAFELYKQARQRCATSKEFYNLFRPDRRALVDRGVPLEQIYLIEDKLIKP